MKLVTIRRVAAWLAVLTLTVAMLTTGWCLPVFAFDIEQGEQTVTDDEYVVRFLDMGGTPLKEETVFPGGSATAPEAPKHEGYDFIEWDTDFSNVTSSLTVTAVYQIKTYTVVFKKGWNGEVLKTETVEYGKAATAPLNTQRDNYTFRAWNKAFDTVESDLVVVALYDPANKYGTNLIENGDFEDASALKWSGSSVIAVGEGTDGGNALKLTSSLDKNESWYTPALMSKLSPNTYYELSFDYKTDGHGALQVADATDVFADTEKLTSTDGWSHYSARTRTGDMVATNTGTELEIIRHKLSVGVDAVYVDNLTLVPLPSVESVSLNETAVTVTAKRTFTLVATPVPENAIVLENSWESDTPAVATVDDTGKVRTLAYGTAKIKAIIDGHEAICTVTVDPAAELIDNGEFETDDLSSWYEPGTLTDNGRTGRGMTISGATDQEAHYYKGQNALLLPNSIYTLTYDYTGKAPTFWINSGTAANNNKDVRLADTTTQSLGDGWTRVEQVLITGAAPKLADNFSFSLTGGKESAVVDAVSFKLDTVRKLKTVVYYDYDGQEIKRVVLLSTQTPVNPADPERTGYTFKQWNAGVDEQTGAITMTAEYTINTYTVTFKDWDGKLLKTEIVEYGKAATAPTDPQRKDYIFNGWDVDFSEVTDTLTVTATYKNAIVYGDATGDIAVDSKDVVRLRKYLAAYDFETKTSTVDINPGGDANGDGTIDSKDVVRLRKYLAAYDFETGTSTVPLGPEE